MQQRSQICLKYIKINLLLAISLAALACGALASGRASADSSSQYITYWAVYCSNGQKPQVPSSDRSTISCGSNQFDMPLFKKVVASDATNPKLPVPSTVIEVDCYPDKADQPDSLSVGTNTVPCGSLTDPNAPDSTFTVGTSYPADLAASAFSGTGSGKSGSSAKKKSSTSKSKSSGTTKSKASTKSAATTSATTTPSGPTSSNSKDYCGNSSNRVYISIDIGCKGEGNPIMDMLFAIIRLLSDGVGLIVIASLIFAGIQYTTSGGDPSGVQHAKTRILHNLYALAFFFFAYGLLNYLIPGMILS